MSTPDPRLRIGDSDRERAMADLAMHYTDGRLDHEEYDERLDAVWTARTRADLAVLFSDLPRPQATHPPAARARTRQRSHGRMPLLPVLAVLIVLSALLNAPFWLLALPLIYLRGRRSGGRAPMHGPSDYRRPGRSTGW